MNIANLRILRMALGTALSMWFSQAMAWNMSFIAPVFTMFILALPVPAIGLRGGVKFVLVLVSALLVGLLFLPFLLHQRLVGLLLLSLALFWSFFHTARGGSPVVGTFLTVGLSLATAVGTVSVDALLDLIQGVGTGACFGVAFVWVAHAILPDSSASPESTRPPGKRPPPPPPPDVQTAGRLALRSLMIVMPILVWFLLSGSSASYAAVMIKVASMGQQVTTDQTSTAARSLLISTVIGGIGAIIGWEILSMWPSLLIYTLLIGLAGLVVGRRVFSGPGMLPTGGTWTYGYLTMIVLLAPAVLDGQGGGSADAAFWSRLLMFFGATIYSVLAVYVFDAFKSSPRSDSIRIEEAQTKPI
ncbi:MAG: hypothetical protein DRP71_01515 [Verrucomicrobia bacterium]|nr:MAG: hypothetical protein DRP71_01515 [Verrucomicrobiota bacterium]